MAVIGEGVGPTTGTAAAAGSGGGSNNGNATAGIVTISSWPNACPLQNEEYFISVIVGNSRLHWALHSGIHAEYYPTLFWKTVPVVPTDTPKPKLRDFLPQTMRDIIYGSHQPSTTTTIAAVATAGQPSSSTTTAAATATTTTNTTNPNTSTTTTSTSSTNKPNKQSQQQQQSHESDAAYCVTARAASYRATFRIPAISIYIISTNEIHLQGLLSLFRNTIPCRLFHLTAKDFTNLPKVISSSPSASETNVNDTTTKTGIGETDAPAAAAATTTTGAPKQQQQNYESEYYSGMGVDRICALFGATYLYQPQKAVLVIDGGTAMTYTGTEKVTGLCIGGGIGPGLRMKFRSLFDYTSALPYITYDIISNHIKNSTELLAKGVKQELFTQSTEQALIACVLKETASNVSSIIHGWMTDQKLLLDDKNNTAATASPSSGTTNEEQNKSQLPVVVLTGGDSDILSMLLKEKHSNLCYYSARDSIFNDIIKAVGSKQLEITMNKHLLHHGIQSMLLQQEQMKQQQQQQDKNDKSSVSYVREYLLGQRVATISMLGEVTTGNIVMGLNDIPKRAAVTYGSVIQVFTNKTYPNNIDGDYYSIFWDISGAIDDVSTKTLYDYLVLYSKANEKAKEKDEHRQVKLEIKRNEAAQAAAMLAERSEAVKAMMSARTANTSKKAPPATASGSTTAGNNKRAREETTPPGGVDKKGKIVPPNDRDLKTLPPKAFVNRRVAKKFDGEKFYGSVKSWTPAKENDEGVDLWLIEYDDGDAEDLEKHELISCLKLWSKNITSDLKYQETLRKNATATE